MGWRETADYIIIIAFALFVLALSIFAVALAVSYLDRVMMGGC